MKDIILLIVKYIPNYLIELGSLFSGPKEFFRKKDISADDTFVSALMFLAISLAIGFLFTRTFPLDKTDPWNLLGRTALNQAIGICLVSGAVILAWLMVGAKIPPRAAFIITTYYAGILGLINSIFYPAAIGTMKLLSMPTYDRLSVLMNNVNGDIPNLSKEFLEHLFRDGNGYEMYVFFLTFSVGVAGMIISFVWYVIGWGAFRNISGLSRQRSAIALIVVLVLFVPISSIASLIAIGLTT